VVEILDKVAPFLKRFQRVNTEVHRDVSKQVKMVNSNWQRKEGWIYQGSGSPVKIADPRN
jgi:hypothetical protein